MVKVYSFLLFSFLVLSPLSYAMEGGKENSTPKKCYVVYSPGFGEGDPYNYSEYFKFLSGQGEDRWNFLNSFSPDAPGVIEKAVFYNRPAVLELANDLHATVSTGKGNSLILVGRSCGGGISSVLLPQLLNYKDSGNYFKGSAIASQEDATKVIDAVNNGGLVLTAPLIELGKANAIAIPSSIASVLTCGAGTMALRHFGKESLSDFDSNIVSLGMLWVSFFGYCCFGDYIKNNFYASLIKRFIVEPISMLDLYSNKQDFFDQDGYKKHYDPNQVSPLEAVKQLRGKLKCPVFIHFHKNDRVLEGPDKDSINFVEQFLFENPSAYVIVTDDSWHNSYSPRFFTVLKTFKDCCLDNYGGVNASASGNIFKDIKDFRKYVYPYGFFSSFILSKKYTLGLVTLLSTLLLWRIIHKDC